VIIVFGILHNQLNSLTDVPAVWEAVSPGDNIAREDPCCEGKLAGLQASAALP